MEANTVADGFFHVGTWLFVLTGSALMLAAWRRGRRPAIWRFQTGLMLAGWGIFDLLEGLVNHQALGVHHVRDDLGGPLSWDLGFLAFGVLLTAAGWALHVTGQRGTAERSGASGDVTLNARP